MRRCYDIFQAKHCVYSRLIVSKISPARQYNQRALRSPGDTPRYPALEVPMSPWSPYTHRDPTL